MPYHVTITRKSDKFGDTVELDFSKAKLIENIVKPYHEGNIFHCDGKIIDPYEVSAIKIRFTKEKSDFYRVIVKEKRKESKVGVLGISEAWEIANMGKDVTRDFIKHMPSKKLIVPAIKTDKVADVPKKINYANIFLGFFILLIIISLISYILFFPSPSGDCHFYESTNHSEFRVINNGDKDANVIYSVQTIWEERVGNCTRDIRTYRECNELQSLPNDYSIICPELPLKKSIIIRCEGSPGPNQTFAIRYNSNVINYQYNCVYVGPSYKNKWFIPFPKLHKILVPLVEKVAEYLPWNSN